MKLHDDIRPDPPSEREKVLELIPWYVMGALPEDEEELVRTYAEQHADIAEEIRKESQLAKEVAKTDPFDAPLERSWNTLRAQVEADIAARTPAKSTSGWLAALQGRGLAVFGGVATACVALAVVVSLNTLPEGDFVTLTSGSDASAPMVQFQAADGLTAEALQPLLAELGVVAITGPSEAGVFTATLGEGADVDAIAKAMSERADILFAAPEASQ